ncbi:probable RNA methyltransferase At5g51130 isoform X2 [Rhodamnia argentea]|uniref:RNA methyltransferase n=1 Tax=Rhodamnia argentea TaxID=178133 RepID=A0ABM3HC36_9MYRT|nr:probable RNA methyltransferase At5g51130 isoform X2 [Rhodamnia argentea]
MDGEIAEEERGQPKKRTQKRNRKEFAPFGNYRSYYGYRVGQELDEDPRLKVLKKEWFEGKDCLDVGCNIGLVAIYIAKKFCCRSILGIDIDSNRIEDAYWNLRKTVRMQSAGKSHSKTCQSGPEERPDDDAQNLSMSKYGETGKSTKNQCLSEKRDLDEIVSFRKENFVLARADAHESYDTILCLSVTKWIHLNWGDEGLITLFSKIWRLLRQTTAANYDKIMYPPEIFQDILLDKIGFRTVEDLTSGLSGTKAGFNRPVLAFRK